MSDTTPNLFAISLVYDPVERSLHIDVGNMPAPLAWKLLDIAAEEMADLSPVDSVVTNVGGAEFSRLLYTDDDDEGT